MPVHKLLWRNKLYVMRISPIGNISTIWQKSDNCCSAVDTDLEPVGKWHDN